MKLNWALAGSVVAFALTTQSGGVAAYLPVVGPSVIRFQKPPKPPQARLAQDPLPVPAPEIGTNQAAVTNHAAAVPVASPESLTVKSPAPPPDDATATNEPSLTLLPPLPSSTGSAITPQMLVPFFYQKTPEAQSQGKETGVIGPLLFTPPRAGPKASSKATFKTE